METDFDLQWSGKFPIDEQDLLNSCTPLKLLISLLDPGLHERDVDATDSKMLAELREKGIMTANATLPELLFNRGGGFLIDQGVVNHIISGTVGVRSGVGIQSLERGAIVLTDGSRLEADAIILA